MRNSSELDQLLRAVNVANLHAQDIGRFYNQSGDPTDLESLRKAMDTLEIAEEGLRSFIERCQ